VRGIAFEAYSYEAGQFSKSQFILSFLLNKNPSFHYKKEGLYEYYSWSLPKKFLKDWNVASRLIAAIEVVSGMPFGHA
jgi:hypothetical protein